MARSTLEARRALWDLACSQGGYFTAKQAQSVGYGYRHLDYHETAGNFERTGHGVYRLRTVPLSRHDDLVRLTLWSRNREDEPQAVVSHETAFFLHDISELIPHRIHLTVPPGFRKPTPEGCVIHKAELKPNEIEAWEGFFVTTPLRTILDGATGSVCLEQLEKGIDDALSRGLVRRCLLEEAPKGPLATERIAFVLDRRGRNDHGQLI